MRYGQKATDADCNIMWSQTLEAPDIMQMLIRAVSSRHYDVGNSNQKTVNPVPSVWWEIATNRKPHKRFTTTPQKNPKKKIVSLNPFVNRKQGISRYSYSSEGGEYWSRDRKKISLLLHSRKQKNRQKQKRQTSNIQEDHEQSWNWNINFQLIWNVNMNFFLNSPRLWPKNKDNIPLVHESDEKKRTFEELILKRNFLKTWD